MTFRRPEGLDAGGGTGKLLPVKFMKEEIVRIQRDALARIAQASDRRGVEDARVAILGKKGN